MGSLFRSEETCLCQLFLQTESAYSIVAELGELGIAQFRDLNPGVNAFQRKYVSEVRRCEEMERQLRYIENEIHKEEIKIPDPDVTPPAPNQRQLVELEATLDKVEGEIREVNTNMTALRKSNNELVELSHILRLTQHFFEEGMAPTEDEIVAMGLPEFNPDHPEEELRPTGRRGLTSLAGVVARSKAQNMERMLWRASRGNVYFRFMDIGQVDDPASGEKVHKCVYIMFFPGTELEPKIRKICEAFHATVYPCPETPQARREMSLGIMSRLKDLETVLKQSKEHRNHVLSAAAKHVREWLSSARKVKAIFHTLNLFNLDVTQKCLIAECWIPFRYLDDAQKALARGTVDSGGSVPSILHRLQTSEQPPTYNKVNKFTTGFQSIVDAYGVGAYREVNPTPFTIITFPFLFAVMFGDTGHGIIMTCFAAFLVLRERQLAAAKIRDEIFNTFFDGRYIILLMGLFAIYTGTIYNDTFSKSFNIYGSAWRVPYSDQMLQENLKLQMDPNTTAFLNYPYPYGLDPVWNVATNKLNFINSFKMKISVILGIFQMMLGVILSLFNYRYFRSTLDIFAQFIPQLLFLSCIFVYLCVTILYKWIVFPAGHKWVPVGYYPGSHCAPSLLIGLINMFMLKKREEGFAGPTCSTNAYYKGQWNKATAMNGTRKTLHCRLIVSMVTVERILLFIALLCVPAMLLTKPLVLKIRNNRKKKREAVGSDIPLTVVNGEHTNGHNQHRDSEKGIETAETTGGEGGGGHGHGEEFNFAEIFIHQAIHTIEYCLGCISHTASYLRLWALSLAHAQLSEVLWTMVMRMAFKKTTYVGVPMTFAIFFAFACLTVCILVVMEGLSAFLHALRLHWVEFQSKFYAGTGYLFEPFSFKNILALAQQADEDQNL